MFAGTRSALHPRWHWLGLKAARWPEGAQGRLRPDGTRRDVAPSAVRVPALCQRHAQRTLRRVAALILQSHDREGPASCLPARSQSVLSSSAAARSRPDVQMGKSLAYSFSAVHCICLPATVSPSPSSPPLSFSLCILASLR